jgi:hypothetical protein
MNHLFNAVPYKGGWACVEPQAVWTNSDEIWMKNIWGSKYNPKYNEIVTDDYLRYVK